MHRLLVPTSELSSDAPQLSKEAANHLKVLRPKDGEEIELFDGKGKWRVFLFRRDKSVASPLVSRGRGTPASPQSEDLHLQPPPPSLTLFACVTKGSRWDWTIEKATELGVTRIVPVISDRTIVRVDAKEREAKRERWTRIAEDAARQSDAKWIPEVLAPVTFAESLALVRETQCFVGALTMPPPRTIGAVLGSLVPHICRGEAELPKAVARAVCVLARGDGELLPAAAEDGSRYGFSLYVGPEGDFTPAELSSLLEIATPVSFGTTILRAETAAIYGVSVLKSFLDLRLATTDSRVLVGN